MFLKASDLILEISFAFWMQRGSNKRQSRVRRAAHLAPAPPTYVASKSASGAWPKSRLSTCGALQPRRLQMTPNLPVRGIATRSPQLRANSAAKTKHGSGSRSPPSFWGRRGCGRRGTRVACRSLGVRLPHRCRRARGGALLPVRVAAMASRRAATMADPPGARMPMNRGNWAALWHPHGVAIDRLKIRL